MTKNLFVIVATVFTYLWSGAMTAEAADFKTLDGTWTGRFALSSGGPSFPVTVTLTTRGEKRITGTIELGPINEFMFNGTIDGYTIEKTVFFIRSVFPPPSGFTCPNDFPPVTAVLHGIASIDDMNPIVQIVTQSGTDNCGQGLIVTMTLNKQ